MKEPQIINQALEKLEKQTHIQGKWKPVTHKELDGQIIFNIDNLKTIYNIECKRELRHHQMEQLINLNNKFNPLMVVANRIFPKIKEELRQNKIAYLEANGNIFLRNDDAFIWIDGNKPLKNVMKVESRAFTKTGLKVLFQFLIDETWINKPYREIAGKMKTGIGNLTNIMKGLKQEGFILPMAKNEYKLNNKKELIDKWTEAYGRKLKPTLKIGTFRFLKNQDFTDWKNLTLKKGKTRWGGEPAADLLTNYLRPAELTLYTTETKNELIKNYRLIPDENGNVKAYLKFWDDRNDATSGQKNDNITPPLLVYADLINTNDNRCTETAQKIYEQYLQN